MYLGKWDGGTYEVDIEASPDEGSLGASLCDSVGSEDGAAGEGGAGAAGEGRMGFEDTVQGKLVLECLGKERQLHEEWLNYAKKEKVESSLNDVADISKETKSAVKRQQVFRCRGAWIASALSGSEEARVFQSALPNSLRNRGELNTCSREGGYEGVVDGCDSIQTSFVSRVEDSLGTRPSLDEVERSGVGVVEEGDVGCPRTLVNVHPKISVIHGPLDNRDFDMLDEMEEARGLEVPASGECGRACPPEVCRRGWGRAWKVVRKVGEIMFFEG
ncbi:hypothetical protein ACSQ67_025396 [Phaseolus vulgaris]